MVLPLHDAERIFARFARYPDYSLYVAEQDGRIVGSFALLIMDNLGHLGAPSAIVEDVVVGPVLHGRGIGRAMMRFAMARATEKTLLQGSCCRRTPSVSVHTASMNRLGFERHGFSYRTMLEKVPA